MKNLCILLVGSVLMLAGCVAPGPVVTGSSASGRLLHDTTRTVLIVDSARRPDCKERRVISAEPLLADKPGAIAERWRVECAGANKFYRITFTPTPSIGGTDFSVQEEK